MIKSVKYLLPTQMIDMGGIPMKQAFPTEKVGEIDPFLLLHHGILQVEDWIPAHRQGVEPHPHRGFTAVTFVIDGEIQHRDSLGNNQIAGIGDVHWLFAGSGLIHSERPSKSMVEEKKNIEIVQLWINAPGRFKLDHPSYQYISHNEMIPYLSEDKLVETILVAGAYKEEYADVPSKSAKTVLWCKGMKGGVETINIADENNVFLYLIKGQIQLKKYGPVDQGELVYFEKEGDEIIFTCKTDVNLIICSGKPINEEIIKNGPFVMNNQTEIMEAMRDFNQGKMGILVEDF